MALQAEHFDNHRYKTAKQVVQMLIDIVSKNGNPMLSIPLPGNGQPDDDELKSAGWFDSVDRSEWRRYLWNATMGRLR